MAEDIADASFDLAEIEKLFTKAKSSGEAYPFAFGLASKPEECGLSVHLRKGGDVLKKELKKASPAIRKVCFGTFTIDGSDVRLQSESPIKGIIKQLKKRFRDAGMMKYKPVLIGTDGMELDEDSLPDPTDEEEEEGDEGAAPAAAPPVAATAAPPAAPVTAPELAALTARLVALRPGVAAAPAEQAAALTAAFSKAVGQVKAGDVAGAEATITVLEKVLARNAAAAPALAAAKAPPPPAPPGAAERLGAALAQMVPRIRAVGGPAQAALTQQALAVQALIGAGDAAGALAAIRALGATLAAAETAPAGPAPLDIWNAAKAAVDLGIGQLQSALRGYRHPMTDRIAEFGLNGLSGSGVQTAVMAALFEHRAATGPAREAATRKLAAAAAAYGQFLSGNTLIPHCEKNPFGVTLDIRATMTAALEQITRAA